ncbi:hypothetical protein LJC48_02530 [Desulfovibrio sp. OttesenSCG-928-C06]|nr:hypothetical protein [Desulfovibrio sp. OttesenSCG-928-C06]
MQNWLETALAENSLFDAAGQRVCVIFNWWFHCCPANSQSAMAGLQNRPAREQRGVPLAQSASDCAYVRKIKWTFSLLFNYLTLNQANF